jgi:hypothetical protein
MSKTFIVSAKVNTKTQASYCENSNHWAMAAILWRRLNYIDIADECELILQTMAINPNIKLHTRAPNIITPILGPSKC